MELENIVANTVLMKAKESTRDGKGRSKRWRSMLEFSDPADCDYLRENMELSYASIVTQQPIGENLFEEFCGTDGLLDTCWNFIHRLEDYRTLSREKLKENAKLIFEDFFTPPVQPEVSDPPPAPPSPSGEPNQAAEPALLPDSDLGASETLGNSTAEAYPLEPVRSLLEVSW